MTDHRLRVTLLGPERTVETQWGPRQESDTLAALDIPVDVVRGWTIYQEAIQRALMPDAVLKFPGMSHEEAARLREKWAASFRTERSE